MSSINLDLDFQDYTPTNSAGRGDNNNKSDGRTTHSSVSQPEVQVRIPLTTDNAASFKKNIQSAKSVLNALQSVANLQSSSSSASIAGSSNVGGGGGLSDEALQQLIWLSGKQKNKQQRGSIAASSNWGLGYFAQYLDVTSEDVLQRILWSAVPVRKIGIDLDDLGEAELNVPLSRNIQSSESMSSLHDDSGGDGEQTNSRIFEQLQGKRKHYSYIERFIQSRPDFYGPFWISTTLIFAIAIFSNIVSFMDHRSRMYQTNLLSQKNNNSLNNIPPPAAIDKLLEQQFKEWHYSMDELNMAASVIMFYVTMMPTFLWFLFWFRGCAKYYTLTETICAYGYSLSIFIPLSALLMVQVALFRYLVLIIASLMSGLVLMMSFLPIVRSDPSAAGSHIILVIVPVCQLVLAYIMHRIMLI